MKLRVGIAGTGAVSHLHARAWQNIGGVIAACTNRDRTKGTAFADTYGATFVPTVEDLCADPTIDIVDVCTFPAFRRDAVAAAAKHRKAVLLEKPIATSLESARDLVDMARAAGITLGVVSQHRFDACHQFLSRAIQAGRLGRILQSDAYVKWYRSDEYYSRPVKGSWEIEGGGALINQGIHQIDLLLWLAGPVTRVSGMWQLAAAHKMESEDVVSAVLQYASGATGVIQAATALWPGYSERIEIHGLNGTAVVAGDRLVTWDLKDDPGGEPPPLAGPAKSGASDPLAISVESFEQQFRDFADAALGTARRSPLITGDDGYRALQLVQAIYDSCRSGQSVAIR